MRLTLAFVIVALAAACGPSAAEVRKARTASYTCDRDEVIRAVAMEVEAQQPPLEGVDPENGLVASEFRWHDASGLRQKKGAAVVQEGYVMFAVIAQVTAHGPRAWFVEAQPRVLAHEMGSPRGKELHKGDPEWPDWADGKVDALMIGIHKRLGACAVDEQK